MVLSSLIAVLICVCGAKIFKLLGVPTPSSGPTHRSNKLHTSCCQPYTCTSLCRYFSGGFYHISRLGLPLPCRNLGIVPLFSLTAYLCVSVTNPLFPLRSLCRAERGTGARRTPPSFGGTSRSGTYSGRTVRSGSCSPVGRRGAVVPRRSDHRTPRHDTLHSRTRGFQSLGYGRLPTGVHRESRSWSVLVLPPRPPRVPQSPLSVSLPLVPFPWVHMHS